MSSRTEIIEALTAFYQQIIKQPYLDDTALKIPPASGWTNIDNEVFENLGRHLTVSDLLRHLPYLETDPAKYERHIVEHETSPIAYTQRWTSTMDVVTKLPKHCVYLMERVERQGYSLILDVEKGTITEYSISDLEILSKPKAHPRDTVFDETWREQRTLPAADLLNSWTRKYARLVNMLVPSMDRGPSTGRFYSRAIDRDQAESLALETGPLVEWQPNMDELIPAIEDEGRRRQEVARWQHKADVYNCFLRYGWPDAFDKSACRAAVIELEKKAAEVEKQFLEGDNPDAALSSK